MRADEHPAEGVREGGGIVGINGRWRTRSTPGANGRGKRRRREPSCGSPTISTPWSCRRAPPPCQRFSAAETVGKVVEEPSRLAGAVRAAFDDQGAIPRIGDQLDGAGDSGDAAEDSDRLGVVAGVVGIATAGA